MLAYNKRNVKPEDVPKTYEDLLKPMWKGRQIINDTDNFEWFDGLLKFWGRDEGLAYFRRLAQQDQIFQRGARGRIQLVAAGEAPLTIGYGPHAQSFVNQGAPIEWVPLEPVVVIVNSVSIAQRAPHPAAAKLFIDFLFSKPAQLKLRELSRIPSRNDVDADPPRLITNQRIQKGRSRHRERKYGGVDQALSANVQFNAVVEKKFNPAPNLDSGSPAGMMIRVRFSRSADPSYAGCAPYLIHHAGHPHLFPPPHERGRMK